MKQIFSLLAIAMLGAWATAAQTTASGQAGASTQIPDRSAGEQAWGACFRQRLGSGCVVGLGKRQRGKQFRKHFQRLKDRLDAGHFS